MLFGWNEGRSDLSSRDGDGGGVGDESSRLQHRAVPGRLRVQREERVRGREVGRRRCGGTILVVIDYGRSFDRALSKVDDLDCAKMQSATYKQVVATHGGVLVESSENSGSVGQRRQRRHRRLKGPAAGDCLLKIVGLVGE